jgi:hypothetical protein
LQVHKLHVHIYKFQIYKNKISSIKIIIITEIASTCLQIWKITKLEKIQIFQVHFCIFTSKCTCSICMFLDVHVLRNCKIIKIYICRICKLQSTKLQITNEKLQPITYNISKLTSK